MGVCNCSMFCFMLLYVCSSIAIILMGKREFVALLNLSFWCLVVVGRLFLAVPRGCLQFVIVVFPDHTHLLFLNFRNNFQTLAHVSNYSHQCTHCLNITLKHCEYLPLSRIKDFGLVVCKQVIVLPVHLLGAH